ncbi:MAG: hypothetical protein KF901_15225 [Myxococcales bacterium]|nr:hypothetical protein [Myxococcales bacterium]
MARGGVDWGEGLTRDALEGADDALFHLSRGLGRASSASQGVDAFRSASSDGPQMFGSHERRLEVTGGDATPERADRTVAPERPQMFGCDDHRRVKVASDDAALGRADRAAAPEAPEMFRCDDHRRVDVASDDATLERTDRTVTPEAPQMFGCDEHRRVEAAGSADGSDVRAASGRRRFGHTTLRVRCPEDVALYFRQLEVSYERAGLPGSFLRFAATAFFHVALPQIAEERKYHGIHVRDRMRCTSPVCNSRNVTCHHVRYRAHRGGDEPENLTSPCDFCHLEGEHEGRLRIRGEAPNLRWEIGRTPIVIVEGRERRDTRARDSEAADRFERSDRSSAV